MKLKLSNVGRKNVVIFSLVIMLGLIGYINYSLNRQSLLQTSSELEQYRMTMLEESGMMLDLLEEDALAEEDELENQDQNPEEEAMEDVEEQKETEDVTKEELETAQVVDSRSYNEVVGLVEETNTEIAQTITNREAMQRNTYFIESRLERDKKRSEMISYLNDIINNQLTSEEIRGEAQNVKLDMISSTEKEVLIENMIVGKGFNDALVYLTDQSINVVVNADALTETDVAKIVDIIRRETTIGMQGITIMNKK
ncbi:stage III sporulation protein AH [Clostridium aceticum]|uniref:Stage III sporulation protein AH n=1 Tax=Clostridium aceticum TaxID=84022 RepID=A0A0D8IDS5_9CLOT|nr:SpoIIIAH-like family protein [Clostridium aceticum]AKL95297.1 stage III sporulation protein AH [Clostridium aceticum]KJF28142.1 stage III sporulation protein AH [Clostridium aceticum]